MKSKILNYKRTILFMIRLLNIAIIVSLFAYAWYSYYADPSFMMTVKGFFRKGDMLVVAVYGILVIAFTQLNGGYKVGECRVGEMIYSNVVSLCFINVIYYLFMSLIWRGFPNPTLLIIMTVIQFFYAAVWSFTANRLYYRLYKARKMVCFYQGAEPGIALTKMNQYKNKYDIQKTIVLTKDTNIEEIIKDYEAVLLDRVDPDLKDKCIRTCYASNKRLYLVPLFTDVVLEGSSMINIIDTPLYLMKNHGLSFEQHLVKRIVDLIICIPIFILTIPIMLLTMVAIKLEDHGPVFYKQKRLTLEGKVFEIIKFRSMRTDAEKDGVAVLMRHHDDRITKVGRFIRKCRIDELPQLLNVLKGDMTIIGPRPERPEIAEEYYKTMPEFRFRLNGKAGITGYAQVMGKYNTTPYDKLMFDLMYLENYSFMFDIKIALLTFKTLFNLDATEGVKDENENTRS